MQCCSASQIGSPTVVPPGVDVALTSWPGGPPSSRRRSTLCSIARRDAGGRRRGRGTRRARRVVVRTARRRKDDDRKQTHEVDAAHEDVPPSCRVRHPECRTARSQIDRISAARPGDRMRVLGTLPMCSCGCWGRSESTPTAALPSRFSSDGTPGARCARCQQAGLDLDERARRRAVAGPTATVGEQGGADQRPSPSHTAGRVNDPDDRARLPAGR